MHLTRPKSSKGRSRPPVSSSSTQSLSASPHDRSTDGILRSCSQPTMRHSDLLTRDQVLQLPQHGPPAPPQTLNKYKVLPSIERRQIEMKSLDNHMSKLHLFDDATIQQSQKHEGPDRDLQTAVRPKPPPDPGPIKTEEAGSADSLLLAIRAPSGRRFQHHFEPTDSLWRVRETAELRFGVHHGEVSIETMAVPRRSFTDLDLTLAQCGIMNRSVLCISHIDRKVDIQ